MSDHLALNQGLLPVFRKYEAEIDSPYMINRYQSILEQEESVRRWNRRNQFTTEKQEINLIRNKTYRGLVNFVRIHLRNFDPQLQSHAKHLYRLLEGYGKIYNIGCNAKTVNIDSIISHLRHPDYLSSVEALGLTPWVDELENQNNRFKMCVEAFLQQEVQKPKINSTEARQMTDQALKEIIKRVSGMIEVEGVDKFVGLINEFNAIVEHYNNIIREHYGRMHAKINLSAAEIAVILPQPYTGKPVFVIPSVYLCTKKSDGSEETVELTFAQDFTISYKNNTAPGTAMLTIEGIGKYKGKTETTFNIEIEN
jgi:hypothetical protein